MTMEVTVTNKTLLSALTTLVEQYTGIAAREKELDAEKTEAGVQIMGLLEAAGVKEKQAVKLLAGGKMRSVSITHSTRKALSVDKLMGNGVTAEQIGRSWDESESKPFLSVR